MSRLGEESIMRIYILITLLLSIGISQQLDDQDVAYNELKVIIETASRSQQTV